MASLFEVLGARRGDPAAHLVPVTIELVKVHVSMGEIVATSAARVGHVHGAPGVLMA